MRFARCAMHVLMHSSSLTAARLAVFASEPVRLARVVGAERALCIRHSHWPLHSSLWHRFSAKA
jgi:hypothetical protein